MRDSFLRQFLEQGGDVTGVVSSGSVTAKDIPVMQPGKPGKTDDVAVLSSTHPKSSSSALARHLAVAEIVRSASINQFITHKAAQRHLGDIPATEGN